MADLLQRGHEWLTDMRAKHMSRDVAYHPVSGGSATVAASINRTVFEVDRGDGVLEQVESRDFIVAALALAAAPVRGDRIVEVAGGTTFTYEVMAPGGGQPARHADSARTAWRIHTKLVSQEATT